MNLITRSAKKSRPLVWKIFQQSPPNRKESSSQHDEFEWQKPYGAYDGIEVYNCAARRKVSFVKRLNNFVTFYTCGPTVYDSAHLGHASAYVKLDIIQRILREHFNLNLITAMNITDIDDKIIRRSHECGRAWKELARGYEAEFWSDMSRLNVQRPNVTLRVSEHVPNIINFIQILLDKGLAYVAADKSVYFKSDSRKYHNKLQNIGDESSDYAGKKEIQGKVNAADFALWKSQKSPDEPHWSAPWGNGRPGWHTECSALASMLFGNVIDFHAGGIDLRFPHHENEEAQSCAYHDTDQWVNYWLHVGQLNVQGESIKMSKSLGNTVSISNMLDSYSPDEFRMACLLSNYNSDMTYSKEMMDMARNTWKKFESFNINCEAYLTGTKRPRQLDSIALIEQLKFAAAEFDARLKNDFNTAQAISVLIDQITSVNRCINEDAESAQPQTAPCLDVVAAIRNFIYTSVRCFGLYSSRGASQSLAADCEDQSISKDMKPLLDEILSLRGKIRERATAEKNVELFQISDELRSILQRHQIDVRDHGERSSWSTNKNYSR